MNTAIRIIGRRLLCMNESGKKYIHREYECSDLEKLFEIASMYNAKGRAYVLEKYVK